MKKSEHSTEEEVLKALMNAVDKIETFTKKVGYRKFEQPLGFVFARVIDNKFTRSEKGKKELEKAIIRAAAFVIVTQILVYLVLSKGTQENNLDINTVQDTKQMQALFDGMVTNTNYKTIFNTRIVELLPEESVASLDCVFKVLLTFQLQKFTSDVLGKLFHGLIPFELRKFLAAYYTSNVVGEFLSYLAIKNANHKVLDPACGSGTLLVSAYHRLKELNEDLSHSKLLQNLYGLDVSVFAAQLAGINLALQNPVYPLDTSQIVILDAFKLNMKHKKGGTELKIPKVDVLLGNPPFTRGDRLDSEYKDYLETHLRIKQDISFNYNKKYLGLYAYFLLDSLRLLKENGILAFVLPLSLINSYTMKPVLKFLLSKFILKYVITSEAQITFSEQCAFKEILFIAQKGENNSSKAKFVVLKRELSTKNSRFLGEKIEETTEDYEDSYIRIHNISNQVLKETVEMNWTIYLFNKAFFKLFEQIRQLEMTTPITQLVKTPRYDVDRGLRAGISDFFYLPNKYWKIIDESNDWIKIQNIENNSVLEVLRQYITPVLRKSSHYIQIIPEISDYAVVIPDNNSIEKAVKDYVKWGAQKFHKRGFESLTYKHIKRGRKMARVAITHELSLLSNNIIAYYSPHPVIITDNFIFIRTINEENDKILAAYLNSSIFLLTYFALRREKTGALGQIFGTDVRHFFCLDPQKVKKTDRKELMLIFDRFMHESSQFPSFYQQIRDAMDNKNHIRFLLDKKICEILTLSNESNFLRQLYETLAEELNKFIS